jgi:hypothetical protein
VTASGRLLLLLIAAQFALLGEACARPITLRCQLMNSVPRNGGPIPDQPFIWWFRVDLNTGTVDGIRATVSDAVIGWAGRAAPALPNATLVRPGWELNGHRQPDWRFHSERQIGAVWNNVDGSCVPQS